MNKENTTQPHGECLGGATNLPGATKSIPERMSPGTRMEILGWMKVPRSSGLLSRCEALELTPAQVANPEMLLSRGARVLRRIGQWLERTGYRIGKVRGKCSVKFYAAFSLQGRAAMENQKIVQRVLTTLPTRVNYAALLDSLYKIPNDPHEPRRDNQKP